VDLIAGLPGEDLPSFGRGFDRLYRLDPHEIQVGILKRLRGTPIARHSETHDMRYNPDPPYNVLQTGCIGFRDMQRISRFARYWEMVANSGRFHGSLALLLDRSPFERFMRFADWLYATTGKTHEMALERLFEHVHRFLTTELGIAQHTAANALLEDYAASGARGRLTFAPEACVRTARAARGTLAPLRQVRHLHR
jgi:hypothetical protein